MKFKPAVRVKRAPGFGWRGGRPRKDKFCKKGHRYVKGSYYDYGKKGGRQCKLCFKVRRMKKFKDLEQLVDEVVYKAKTAAMESMGPDRDYARSAEKDLEETKKKLLVAVGYGQ